MPKTWLYYIAVCFPLILGIAVCYTGFVDWLWYQRYENTYYLLSALRENLTFRELVAGWALPVFVITVFSHWATNEDEEAIAQQFLLLPLVYVVFAVLGNFLLNRAFDPMVLYTYPLIVIPIGYLYIFPWVVFIWVFSKLKLVM